TQDTEAHAERDAYKLYHYCEVYYEHTQGHGSCTYLFGGAERGVGAPEQSHQDHLRIQARRRLGRPCKILGDNLQGLLHCTPTTFLQGCQVNTSGIRSTSGNDSRKSIELENTLVNHQLPIVRNHQFFGHG